MFDILPFPNITSTDTKEQVAQINNYLIQLKEELEFILTNISADNLSSELRDKLNSLGAGIQTTEEKYEEVTQQVRNQSISVSDVINSPLFESAIDEATDDCVTSISVNYETGNLEYEKGGTT
jgi:hypothetical protein